MTSSDSPPEKRTAPRGPEAEAREAERRERLAAALRANLKRRKARSRPDPAADAPKQGPTDG